MIIPSRRRALPALLALIATLGGSAVAWHYHRLGLTLAHYDARGHLVVARRIFDSITPGWQQIGAVWLPLPHLLNALPVQIDFFYRTGASGVAISIASFALAVAGIAWIVQMLTGTNLAAVVAAAVFALNPNVLYLQATPMTEPLLLGLTTMAVALLMDWHRAAAAARGHAPRITEASVTEPRQLAGVGPRLDAAETGESPRATSASMSEPRQLAGVGPREKIRHAGWVFALACLTRYEAWPVTAAALAAAMWARWREGDTPVAACRRVAAIAVYPAAAIIAFVIFSRIVVGQWFVDSGFFVPENKSLGKPILAAAEIGWGVRMLSGDVVLAIAATGLAALVVAGLFVRRRADALVAVSLAATAALPWAAFVKGHPFRIRYMVPLVAAEAVGAGIAAALPFTAAAVSRWRWRRLAETSLAAIVVAVAAYELRPMNAQAPMVVEAQWDRPNQPARQRVTDCLKAGDRGEKIMASMGSLGHYMQEASADGFDVRDFLHEGNGDIWLAALDGPRPFVGWVLIEEKASGGDLLAKIARENPHFLDGFSRVCEGAGLALYRRAPPQKPIRKTAR